MPNSLGIQDGKTSMVTGDVPFVSVIICTRNRAASLSRTLDSLSIAAARMTESWELLVVDNGSTDTTGQVIDDLKDRLPIRRVVETTPGLSNARNAGVSASKGEYVLWTDDDVIVDADWLAAWSRAFRARPGDAVFGGRSRPLYEEPRQPWFEANEKHLDALLAIRDHPDWDVMARNETPYGLNFALRGIEQRRHLYDPELGVAPGRRRGGEEAAVMTAIFDDGGTGSWVWDALVHHAIPSERQTEGYIRTYYQANGYDYPIGGVGRPGGKPRAVLKTLLHWARAGLHYRLLRHWDRAEAAKWLVTLSRAEGSMARHLSRGTPDAG